jgi:hypothetical protein
MIAIYHVFVHNNYFVLPTEHTLNYLRKKLNSSMLNFGERLGQPSKMKLIHFSFLFFCQDNSTGGGFLILKQIIPNFFLSSRRTKMNSILDVEGRVRF